MSKSGRGLRPWSMTIKSMHHLGLTVTDLAAAVAFFEALGMEPDEELFGLYQGVPLAERDSFYQAAMPDRVIIYRGPILRSCDNRREVIREVRDTVVHELGHHFGLDEDDMPY